VVAGCVTAVAFVGCSENSNSEANREGCGSGANCPSTTTGSGCPPASDAAGERAAALQAAVKVPTGFQLIRVQVDGAGQQESVEVRICHDQQLDEDPRIVAGDVTASLNALINHPSPDIPAAIIVSSWHPSGGTLTRDWSAQSNMGSPWSLDIPS
jgi:hypothetical protein